MRRYLHVLLGGLFIGILSVLPIVSMANLCCCLWVVVGGMLTAYLQQQARETPIESGEAAVAGLLAGVLGAVIQIVIMSVLFAASGGVTGADLQARLEGNAQIPPEVREQLIRVFAGPGVLVAISAVVLPAYAVVGALGALLGRAIFRKTAPPPAPEG